MAPESIRDKLYSHSSDCFSLGILMWECFSFGEPPFAALTNLEAVLAVGTGRRMARPLACPKGGYTLMKQMWVLEPHDRPRFAAVVEALQGMRGEGEGEDVGFGEKQLFHADHSADAADRYSRDQQEEETARYLSDEQAASISTSISQQTLQAWTDREMAAYVSFGAGGLAAAPPLLDWRHLGEAETQAPRTKPRAEGRSTPQQRRVGPAADPSGIVYRISTAV